jgi:periplasmic divalent cation tolerance protein
MSKTTNFFLAYITTKNEEEALTLANSAVEKNLAACGNIFPKIKSVYKWDKKLQHDDETLLILKTNSSKYTLLKKIIKEKNSYEVPCILKIPIIDGNKEYLKWIDDSLI